MHAPCSKRKRTIGLHLKAFSLCLLRCSILNLFSQTFLLSFKQLQNVHYVDDLVRVQSTALLNDTFIMFT